MSGITDPTEQYFKDGSWAWDGTRWQKLLVDGDGNLLTAGGAPMVTHNLLDGDWHPDTVAGAPVEGDVIVGIDQGAPGIKWQRLAAGAVNQVLAVQADGSLAWVDLSTLAPSVPAVVVLTNDLSEYTATALTNATGLLFAVVSGKIYHYRFLISYRTAAATTGLKLAVTFPAPFYADGQAYRASIPTAADGTAAEWTGAGTASGDAITATNTPDNDLAYLAIIEGIIKPASSNNLQVQYASEVALSGVVILRGSCGFLYTLT